jgi:AraC-like DNA-binding protein
MMEAVGSSQNFLYSCVDERMRSHEQFVPDHAFGIILSGESQFHTPEGVQTFGEGTMGLIKRNQLLKTLKVPKAGNGPFKSINIIFDQEFLRQYAAEKEIRPGHYTGPGMLDLSNNVFIRSYFDSLLPYFDQPEYMSDAIARVKMSEALELLLRFSPKAKEMLFDFNEPFKIDLDAYMNKHYMYNVSLAQFAKLTGRSLATFKRDFQKTFDMSPERWLQKKRLEHAHYLIANKNQSPSEAYIDVGFENLSHFSTAFKRFFGYSPSSLRA